MNSLPNKQDETQLQAEISEQALTPVDEECPEIRILYEDEHLVAIHKPAGLLVHRTYLARKERFFSPCS